MKLQNDTTYEYSALIDGREYFLGKKSAIEFLCNENTRTMNKSSVHINWLDIFFQMFGGDSTITKLYCDYSFQVKDSSVPFIKLKDNYWHPREQLSIHACYADDGSVINESYSIPHLDRIKKKHRNLHLYVTSLLPVGIILLFCMLFFEPLFSALGFILWFFFFPFLSIKEIKRFKEATKPDYVNNELCRYAVERRTGDRMFGDDTSKTGKFVEKVLGKMFKFDDKEEDK